MEKIKAAVRFVGELFRKKTSKEFENGKGPYAGVDADHGTAWNIFKRSGKSYTY